MSNLVLSPFRTFCIFWVRFFFQKILKISNDHTSKRKAAKIGKFIFHSFQNIAQLFGQKKSAVSEGRGGGGFACRKLRKGPFPFILSGTRRLYQTEYDFLFCSFPLVFEPNETFISLHRIDLLSIVKVSRLYKEK